MVMEMFARNLGVKVIRVDAVDAFMGKLAGVSDPEQKRKIIGKEFVEVFQSESKKLSAAKWLAQGTIYPDVIESAGKGKKGAHTIKSHHNVGGLPVENGRAIDAGAGSAKNAIVKSTGASRTSAEPARCNVRLSAVGGVTR